MSTQGRKAQLVALLGAAVDACRFGCRRIIRCGKARLVALLAALAGAVLPPDAP